MNKKLSRETSSEVPEVSSGPLVIIEDPNAEAVKESDKDQPGISYSGAEGVKEGGNQENSE